MKLTNEQKREILESRILQHRAALYGQTTDAKVARMAGLADLEKRALDNAALTQKMIDGFQAELDQLDGKGSSPVAVS